MLKKRTAPKAVKAYGHVGHRSERDRSETE